MEKISKEKAIRAYKVFNSDWTCRGFQYEVGGTYTHKGRVAVCDKGFHACLKLVDCFSYYPFDPANKVAEVLVWGTIDRSSNDSKIAVSKIELCRELSWHEVLDLVNSGYCNSGHRNSGDYNSGNWQTGAFCTETDPEISLFDKPSGLTASVWQDHKVHTILDQLRLTEWINSDDDEYKTTGGYLKEFSMHEAWAKLWQGLSADEKQVFLDLPNFDAAKFKEITGIRVSEK